MKFATKTAWNRWFMKNNSKLLNTTFADAFIGDAKASESVRQARHVVEDICDVFAVKLGVDRSVAIRLVVSGGFAADLQRHYKRKAQKITSDGPLTSEEKSLLLLANGEEADVAQFIQDSWEFAASMTIKHLKGDFVMGEAASEQKKKAA